jgi:hypothetical protein
MGIIPIASEEQIASASPIYLGPSISDLVFLPLFHGGARTQGQSTLPSDVLFFHLSMARVQQYFQSRRRFRLVQFS